MRVICYCGIMPTEMKTKMTKKRIGWVIMAPTDIATNNLSGLSKLKKVARQFLKDIGHKKIVSMKSPFGWDLIGDDDQVVHIWEILN